MILIQMDEAARVFDANKEAAHTDICIYIHIHIHMYIHVILWSPVM